MRPSLPCVRLCLSGSPFESHIGFSRAVRVGQIVAVSGTAPIAPDGTVASPGDVYGQTRRCLDIIVRRLQILDFPSKMSFGRASC